MSITITYEQFEEQWLDGIRNVELSAVEKGRRFALKLLSDWLDFDGESDDVFYCDGSGDGGIDLAYLQRGDDSENEADAGDTWYIVQSKYNTAFAGKDTIIIEAQKVIDTLRGNREHLSAAAADVVNRIKSFMMKASENDRIVYVVATSGEMSDIEKQTLADVRSIGQSTFGVIFDVDSVSISTIYQRMIERSPKKYQVSLTAELVPSGDDLLVGSVKIVDLYSFLKEYKTQTNDLDLIYEKNVRKFLGSRKKVNKGIRETLDKEPERFGLYNNGITIVAEDFDKTDNRYTLIEPFIVNGCQTTRSIWEVLDPKLSSGGTGKPISDDWRNRLDKGIVVVKIVRIGACGDELLEKTTRYTNSQNAVTNKDFIALEKSFQSWHREFAEKYDIYLEIQRGGWDAQKALERIRPLAKRFDKCARAFDLLKIHGAGWMNKPGLAFGKNPPFAPGGSIFKDIMADSYGFTTNDLYAAYLIDALVATLGFGRGAEKRARGQTKYLFCFTLMKLLKYCLEADENTTNANISRTVINIFSSPDTSDIAKELTESALVVIDEYMSPTEEDSVYHEPTNTGDLNAYLKHDNFGKEDFSPKLSEVIKSERKNLRKKGMYDIVQQVSKA